MKIFKFLFNAITLIMLNYSCYLLTAGEGKDSFVIIRQSKIATNLLWIGAAYATSGKTIEESFKYQGFILQRILMGISKNTAVSRDCRKAGIDFYEKSIQQSIDIIKKWSALKYWTKYGLLCILGIRQGSRIYRLAVVDQTPAGSIDNCFRNYSSLATLTGVQRTVLIDLVISFTSCALILGLIHNLFKYSAIPLTQREPALLNLIILQKIFNTLKSDGIMDMCVEGTYHTFIESQKKAPIENFSEKS